MNTICDDWGWYVDTESNLLITPNKFHGNKYYKNINDYKLRKLCTVDEGEDEYDYYKKNYRDIEKMQLECSNSKVKNKENISNQISLYQIGSTTLITALLTYAIFFLI